MRSHSQQAAIYYRVGYADGVARITTVTPYRRLDKLHFDPRQPDRIIACIPLREVVPDRVRATFVEFVVKNTPYFYVRRSVERINPYTPDEKMYTQWRFTDSNTASSNLIVAAEEENAEKASSESAKEKDPLELQAVSFITSVFNARRDTDIPKYRDKETESYLKNRTVDASLDRVDRRPRIEATKPIWRPPTADEDPFVVPLWIDERHWRLCNDHYIAVATAENAPPLDAVPRILGSIHKLLNVAADHYGRCNRWEKRNGEWPDTSTWPAVSMCTFWNETMSEMDEDVKDTLYETIVQTAVYAMFRSTLEAQPTATAHNVDINDAGCVISYPNAYHINDEPSSVDMWRLKPLGDCFGLEDGRHPFDLYTGIHNTDQADGKGRVTKSSYLIAKRYEAGVPATYARARLVGGREWYVDGRKRQWGEKAYNGEYVGRLSSQLETLARSELLSTGATVRDHLQRTLLDALDRTFDLSETYAHLDERGILFVTHPVFPTTTFYASRPQNLTVPEMRTIQTLREYIRRWRGQCMLGEHEYFLTE